MDCMLQSTWASYFLCLRKGSRKEILSLVEHSVSNRSKTAWSVYVVTGCRPGGQHDCARSLSGRFRLHPGLFIICHHNMWWLDHLKPILAIFIFLVFRLFKTLLARRPAATISGLTIIKQQQSNSIKAKVVYRNANDNCVKSFSAC